MRPLVLWIAISIAPVEAGRLAPNKTREAVLGCWDVGAGASLDLTPFGKHSARFTARLSDRPRGGPAVMKGDATWVPADGEYELLCRPMSQHGSFCRISPVAGGLRIRVFAKGHGDRDHGHLVEDFVAQRC